MERKSNCVNEPKEYAWKKKKKKSKFFLIKQIAKSKTQNPTIVVHVHNIPDIYSRIKNQTVCPATTICLSWYTNEI